MAELEATERPEQARNVRGAEGDAPGLLRIWPTERTEYFDLGRTLTLGRDPVSDIVCESPLASRQHARIERDGPIDVVRDLGSTNGLFLDGQRVEKGPLVPGTSLRFGDQLLLVVRGAASAVEELAPGVFGGRRLGERFQKLRQVATTDLPVIVEGATGTGKEGAARAVHAYSRRKGQFVAVNCAAIPAQLAEAELFGHVRGAFTGATQARAGHLRDADGGTLFLDEVLELPEALGAKLLRALEQGEVVPVGDSRPIRVDVRVVVASQGSLERAVAEQRFRADLFARLDGFTLQLPPLADRSEDIPALFERFVALASEGTPPGIDVELMERLVLEPWPQNIRQLRATARRLVALSDGSETLTLPAWQALRDAAGQSSLADARGGDDSSPEADLQRLLEHLEQAGGNVTRAARLSGMSRPRAYRMLQAAGIDLEQLRGPSDAPSEADA